MLVRVWRSKPTCTGISSLTMACFSAVTAEPEPPGNPENQSRRFRSIHGDASSLFKEGQLKEAVANVHHMYKVGIQTPSSSYAALLQACTNMKSLAWGRQVHAHIMKTGFKTDSFVETKLVILYAKCGGMADACQMFDKMSEPNLVSCNVMITGYAQNGSLEDARRIFDGITERNVITWNATISGYAEDGSLEQAHQNFDNTAEQNVVSWNAMIAGYAWNKQYRKALELCYQMHWASVKPNESTFSSVLSICANLYALENGKQVHALIIKTGFESFMFVEHAFLSMYAKCKSIDDGRQIFDKMAERNAISWTAMLAAYTQNGRLQDAHQLFLQMPERNVISWTAMIAGYVQDDNGEEALRLFHLMRRMGTKPNHFTYDSVIRACANLGVHDIGQQVHASIVKTGCESDISVSSALIDLYIKCRSLEDAHQVFLKMEEQNVISCNAMIGGYLQIGRLEDASLVFHRMSERNVVSGNMMIAGYGNNGRVEDAYNVFENMQERSVASWNTMITVYAQNGKIEHARELFDKMEERSVVSWNAMITGYTQNEDCGEALKLFFEMQMAGMSWNRSTFSSFLSACASMAALENGKKVHGHIIKMAFESDVFVGTSLVDMYAKCGNIYDACKFFNRMPEHNVVTWTAMITGYAQHGLGNKALQFFGKMQKEGVKPNHITFVGVLSACSHAGLADAAIHYFDSMNRDYCITPIPEHYACMVDLLGRSGRLEEAHDFIKKMPFEPDAVVWGALLNACTVHINAEVGKHAGERILELEPKDPATYILLSNLYAAAGKWDDVAKVRKMMKEMDMKKKPGCSWIEIKNRVHMFHAGDRSHPLSSNRENI